MPYTHPRTKIILALVLNQLRCLQVLPYLLLISSVIRFWDLGLIVFEQSKSIDEPDSLIACYSYNSNNSRMQNQMCEVNERIIQSASLTVALPLDNFSGMVDKL